MTDINQLFDTLDNWRHLPAYQLERRADIFFALYLHEVLEHHTGVPLHNTIVPELPIKRDLIWPNKASSSSVKVDYLVVARDLSRAFLVELKTDAGSRRDTQDTYLQRATALGLASILEGLKVICTRTTAHQKYHHLLDTLAQLQLLRLPTDLAQFTFPKPRPGLRKCLSGIQVTVPARLELDVVFIQPASDIHTPNVIDFDAFATVVSGHRDPMSQRFAASLKRWEVAAGASPPS